MEFNTERVAGVAAVVSTRRDKEVWLVWHEPALSFESLAICRWRVKAGRQGLNVLHHRENQCEASGVL